GPTTTVQSCPTRRSSDLTVHIQKTAPGPPKAIAVATPAMLPTPTRPANDIMRDSKDETPFSDLSPRTSCLSMSGIPRIWMNLVRSEEHTSELQSRFDLVC